MNKLLTVTAMTMALGLSSAAMADVSLSLGQTGESTTVARLGAQLDFGSSWLESDVGRLTGYWDAAYTYWDGDKTSSNHSLSLAPVFVYEFNAGSIKPFIEAGIGIAAFENTEIEDKDLGSSFQFEDRIGAGLRFAGGHEISIRAMHYSNAGLKQPNDGIESYTLNYRLPL